MACQLSLVLIYQIVPYKVSYRVVILETETINGTYYILFNANQHGKAVAYYLDSIWGRWQSGKNPIDLYEKGDYFVIKNPSALYDTEETEAFLDYDEVVELCKNNDWVLNPKFEAPKSVKEF